MDADAAGISITGYERGRDGWANNLFVMKLGNSGVVWKSTYGFINANETGYGVTIDTSGYVCGRLGERDRGR